MVNVAIGVANPLYIDTPATIQLGWMTIQTITWTDNDTLANPIANDNDFELTDEAGNLLISKRSTGDGDGFDNPPVIFPFGLKVNGLICTAIDGGVALVYLKSFEG